MRCFESEEQRYKEMEKKGIIREQLNKVQGSLGLVLDLVMKARQEAQEMQGPRSA